MTFLLNEMSFFLESVLTYINLLGNNNYLFLVNINQ